ncbi:hypothetical protein F8388_000935 [Cannabis sativa]|uniref:Serine/threonine-protein phosphatase 2A activator n=1 Tax=Cannabis sativa TaxID=3483 RepID=A0A7J6FQ52_CANSA|nr:hypothetical protein F8388_000935 [Cannabis sativa]
MIGADSEVLIIDNSEASIWPQKHEEVFVGLMEEEVLKGNRNTTTFTKQSWKHIKEELCAQVKRSYTNLQLRNNYNLLRQKHKDFKSLLKETSIGYSEVTGQVTAPDKVWDRLIRVNNPSIDLDNNDDDDAMSKSPSVRNQESSFDEDGRKRRDKSTGTTSSRSAKKAKFSLALAETLTVYNETAKRKIDLYENSMTLTKHHLLDECIEALNQIDGISGEVYAKAIEKFESELTLLTLSAMDHHHQHCSESPQTLSPPPPSSTDDTTTTITTPTCCKCGATAAFNAPPPWSEISPPNYRPIRAPAINLPPNQSQQAIILTPVPQAQRVPIETPPFQFQTPSKRIQSPEDIRRFHESFSGKNFLGFIVALSESVRGRKISDPVHHQSPITDSIVSILETLIQWVDEIPPTQMKSRYGNVSYRVWQERLVENSENLMLRFLPDDLRSSTVEIVPYFTDSFGNSSRIDYGTGHETNFAAWLYCLARLGLIKEEDYDSVVIRIFVKYMALMRKLQTVYCLEPAGSHGVWGLDDYHFLPYIFGSSQLINHKYMKPKSIHNEDILENFSHEYLYLSCIAFVKKVKKGPFSEHSPLLDDISGVPNWNKVNSGLLKMYKVEVLEKVPIMQHFIFGSLIKW